MIEALHYASGHQGRDRTLAVQEEGILALNGKICGLVLHKLFKMLYRKGVETYSKADYGAYFGR